MENILRSLAYMYMYVDGKVIDLSSTIPCWQK